MTNVKSLFKTSITMPTLKKDDPYRFKLNPKIEAIVPRGTEQEDKEMLETLKIKQEHALIVSKDGTLLDGYRRHKLLTEKLGKTEKDIKIEINPDFDFRLPYHWGTVVRYVIGCSNRRNLNAFQNTMLIIEQFNLNGELEALDPHKIDFSISSEREELENKEKLLTLKEVSEQIGLPERRLRSVAFILRNLKTTPMEIQTEFMNGLNSYRGERDTGLSIDNVENRLRGANSIYNTIKLIKTKDATYGKYLESTYDNLSKYQDGAYEKFKKEAEEHSKNTLIERQKAIIAYHKKLVILKKLVFKLEKYSAATGYGIISLNIEPPLTKEQEEEIINTQTILNKRQKYKVSKGLARYCAGFKEE